jgi:hypothetical protein
MARLASGSQKLDHLVSQTELSGFLESRQYFYGNKLVRPPIQNTTTTKFRSSGSSSTGASFDALFPDQATNAWAMGPPPMMYPPCPPWAGWYGPWTPPSMHFHIGNNRYGHVGHEQGRKASGQENQIVQNAKPDHPVFQKAAAAPDCQQE